MYDGELTGDLRARADRPSTIRARPPPSPGHAQWVPQRGVPAATSHATLSPAPARQRAESQTSSLGRFPEITTRVRALEALAPGTGHRTAQRTKRRACLDDARAASISPATPDFPPRTGVTAGIPGALADGRGGSPP